jgi:hypothetical protein
MKRYRRPGRTGKTKERPKAFAGQQQGDMSQRFIGELQIDDASSFLSACS